MIQSINDYLESINAVTAASQNVTVPNSTNQADSVSTDKDSYIASEVDADAVLPSDNYNDILTVIRSNKAESGSMDDGSDVDSDTGAASATVEGSTGAVGSSGGSGGGSSESEDEDETTTKIVTVGGVTYLETTTVSNGVTTVTRTTLNSSEES